MRARTTGSRRGDEADAASATARRCGMDQLSPYQRRRLARAVSSDHASPEELSQSTRFFAVGPQNVTRLSSPPPVARAASPPRSTPTPVAAAPEGRASRAESAPSPGLPPLEDLIVLPRRIKRVAGGYVEVPYTPEELLEYATTAVGWLRAEMGKDLRRLADLPASESPVGMLCSVLSELRASTSTLSEEVRFLERALVESDERGRRCEDAMLIERALHKTSRRTAALEAQQLVEEHAHATRVAEDRLAAACERHEAESEAMAAGHEAALAAATAVYDSSFADMEHRFASRLRRLEVELAAERRLRQAEAEAATRTLDELQSMQHAHALSLQSAVEPSHGVFRMSARAQAQQAAQYAHSLRAAVERLRVTHSELRGAHAMEVAALPPEEEGR